MNYSHKIIFKDRLMEPESIDYDTAQSLMAAKESKQNTPFMLGQNQYMSDDIKAIVRMSRPITSTRKYPCKNPICHRPEREHFEGEVCDYEITGHCETCHKPLWERDREYAVYKFGRVTCAAHCGDPFWEQAAKSKNNENNQANKKPDIPTEPSSEAVGS